MAEPLKDPRFSHVSWDPKFSRVPRRERKVKIDERFKSMFTDSKFKSKFAVDKRGKSIRTNTIEDLKRYYELSSEEEEDEEIEKDQKIDEKDEKNEKIDQKRKNKLGKLKGEKEKVKKSKVVKTKRSKNRQKLTKTPKSDSEFDESESGIDENSIDSDLDSDQEKPKICLDLARGEGNLQSSDDGENSSEEDWDFEEDQNLPEHRWGELDADAPRTEEATNRLAVCNMDWDRVKAKDLLVLFNSFKPPLGIIRSVTIYPSKFGEDRMKDEEINGPIELRDIQKTLKKQRISINSQSSVNSEENDLDLKNGLPESENEDNQEENLASNIEDGSDLEENSDDENEDNFEEGGANVEDEEENLKILEREKIREYQLNRLKYFYAVVECDSVATANQIYECCDGIEYESSATKLDLRFIPDDMSFDDETPRDQAMELGDLDSYKPLHFRNAALQQAGKVELTWDETDPARKQLIDQIFSSKTDKKRAKNEDLLDLDDQNLHKILASGSSDDEESDQERKEKLKSLVDSLLSKNDKTPTKNDEFFEDDGEEIVDSAENVDNSQEKFITNIKKEEKSKQNAQKLTPWQQYLEKRRQKRAEKRQETRRKLEQSRKINNPDQNFDDFDDLQAETDSMNDFPAGIDPNDPYFKEEFDKLRQESVSNRPAKGGRSNRIGQSEMSDSNAVGESENEDQAIKRRQELELLLAADSATDARFKARNFNLKKLLSEDKPSKSKISRKRQASNQTEKESRDQQPIVDNFRFNLNDPRFQSLYNSHLFNIDPTESAFKKTKNMQILLDEKIKRVKLDKNDVHPIENISKIGRNSPEKMAKSDQNSTAESPPQNLQIDDENVSQKTKNLDQKTILENANLNLLVKSIKSKTKTMQMKKDQKKKMRLKND